MNRSQLALVAAVSALLGIVIGVVVALATLTDDGDGEPSQATTQGPGVSVVDDDDAAVVEVPVLAPYTPAPDLDDLGTAVPEGLLGEGERAGFDPAAVVAGAAEAPVAAVVEVPADQLDEVLGEPADAEGQDGADDPPDEDPEPPLPRAERVADIAGEPLAPGPEEQADGVDGALVQRFIDACAVLPDGCPLGIGADVIGPPLEAGPRLEVGIVRRNDISRCPDDVRADHVFDHESDTYPAMVITTRPAAVEVTIAPAVREFGDGPGPTTQVREEPGPGDSEYERWSADPPDAFEGTLTADLVHACFDLPISDGSPHTISVVANSSDGRGGVAEGVVTRPEPLGRPRPSMGVRPGGRLRVGVRTDPGEHAWVYPVDLTQPDAPDCAEVERLELSDRRWPDSDHPDPFIRSEIRVPARTVEGDDGQLRHDYQLPLREGRPYLICIWYLIPGERSFDPPEILDREQWIVQTPARYGVQVVVDELLVGAEGPAAPVEVDVWTPDVWTQPFRGGCDAGMAADASRVRLTVDSGGAQPVGQVLCLVDGGSPPDGFPVGVSVVGGERVSAVLPVDTSCAYDDPALPSCDVGRSEHFVIDVPPEACGGCGIGMAVKVRVDLLPSAGAAQGWTIADRDTFERSGLLPPVTAPQIDVGTFDIGPVLDRSDALEVSFPTSRPVRAELTLHGTGRCEGQTTTVQAPRSDEHRFVVDGLCAGTLYNPSLVLVDDADGEPAPDDPDRVARIEVGWLPWGRTRSIEMLVVVEGRRVARDASGVAESCATTDEIYASVDGVDLGPDCDRSAAVSFDWRVDNVAIGDQRLVGVHPGCLTGTLPLRTVPTRVLVTDTARVSLQVDLDLRTECGPDVPDGWTGLIYGYLRADALVLTDQIRAGLTFPVVASDGSTWEITVFSVGAERVAG